MGYCKRRNSIVYKIFANLRNWAISCGFGLAVLGLFVSINYIRSYFHFVHIFADIVDIVLDK